MSTTVIESVKKCREDYLCEEDYRYEVEMMGSDESVTKIQFHRNTWTTIHNIVKDIHENEGSVSNVRGNTFNRDLIFVAVQLQHKYNGNKIPLEFIDVYLYNPKNKVRYWFNCNDVVKVKGTSFSSTGIRHNRYLSSPKKSEVVSNVTVKNEEVKKSIPTSTSSKEDNIRKKRREYMQKWREKNIDKVREYQRLYHQQRRTSNIGAASGK